MDYIHLSAETRHHHSSKYPPFLPTRLGKAVISRSFIVMRLERNITLLSPFTVSICEKASLHIIDIAPSEDIHFHMNYPSMPCRMKQ